MPNNESIRIETDLAGEALAQFSFALREVNCGLTPRDPLYVTAAQLAAWMITDALANHHAMRPPRLS